MINFKDLWKGKGLPHIKNKLIAILALVIIFSTTNVIPVSASIIYKDPYVLYGGYPTYPYEFLPMIYDSYDDTIVSVKFSFTGSAGDKIKLILGNTHDPISGFNQTIDLGDIGLIGNGYTFNISTPVNTLTFGLLDGANSNTVVWLDEVDFNSGTKIFFDNPPNAPDVSGAPNTGSGSTIPLPTPPATTTDIVNAVNQTNTELSDVNSQLSQVIQNEQSLTNQVSSIGNQLTTIINNQGNLLSEISSIGDQLNQVITNQNTMINTLGSINSTLGNLSDYITTPISSDALSTSSLGSVPTFDPTVPNIPGEPNNQPYTYTTPAPQLPTFVASPGVLPSIPDPSILIMPHDAPNTVNSPISLSDPIVPQPPSTTQLPVVPQAPSSSQAPIEPQAPLIMSSVVMDDPISPSPVQMSTPITPQSPVEPSQPYSMQSPIPPQ